VLENKLSDVRAQLNEKELNVAKLNDLLATKSVNGTPAVPAAATSAAPADVAAQSADETDATHATRPHLRRPPSYSKGLASLAGVSETTRVEAPELHHSSAATAAALDDFLALPRAQQQRAYAALHTAAQRGTAAVPLVARLAALFASTASPGAPAAASHVLTDATTPASAAMPLSPTRRESGVLAADGSPADRPAHATIENMREMLLKEQQNLGTGLQTLRGLPREVRVCARAIPAHSPGVRYSVAQLSSGRTTLVLSSSRRTTVAPPLRPNLKRQARAQTQIYSSTLPRPRVLDLALDKPVAVQASVPVGQQAAIAAAAASDAPSSAADEPGSLDTVAKLPPVAVRAINEIAKSPTRARKPPSDAPTPVPDSNVITPRAPLALIAGGSALPTQASVPTSTDVEVDWFQIAELPSTATGVAATAGEVYVADSTGTMHCWEASAADALADAFAQLGDDAPPPPLPHVKLEWAAHAKGITALIVVGSKLWSAAKDGAISVWSHARQVCTCVRACCRR
jgi:hypothetical protein